MIAIEEKIYTVEEYLELEKTSEIRHEFVYGKFFSLDGDSKVANKITGNLLFFLRNHLQNGIFKVYGLAVKVQVEKHQIYRYPDVIVSLKSDNADTHIVMQPILLAEVVAENSEISDRITKLREYTHLESLQQYLIIDQYEMFVELYRREGDNWIYEVFEQAEMPISLPFFDVTISLEAIYEGVVLPEQF